MGAVEVVTNSFNLITGLFDSDRINIISNIVFGWGIVAIMLGSAFIFYNKKWTANAVNVMSPTSKND